VAFRQALVSTFYAILLGNRLISMKAGKSSTALSLDEAPRPQKNPQTKTQIKRKP
jgi:hypothetical protein